MPLLYETDEHRVLVIGVGHANGHAYSDLPAIDAQSLVAYVNLGRWVADCPECNNGIMVHPDRHGWCCNCGNSTVGGLSRRVRWPADIFRIEAVLEMRPAPANRNWYPHETVNELVHESIANGAPVPFPAED